MTARRALSALLVGAGLVRRRAGSGLAESVRRACSDAGIDPGADLRRAVRLLSDHCRGGWANAAAYETELAALRATVARVGALLPVSGLTFDGEPIVRYRDLLVALGMAAALDGGDEAREDGEDG